MLSIIIIALNEEKYIGKLLRSIIKQDYPCEVIVVDGKSTDRTADIARRYADKVIIAQKRGVSYSRNIGARTACGDTLVFFDSDMILPPGFLSKNLKEFNKRKLGTACTSIRPLSKRFDDILMHGMYNEFQKKMARTKPFAPGFLFTKKKVFNLINGFDETVKYAEECDYAIRSKKYGFGVLKGPKILISVRRLEKEGRKKFIKMMIKYTLHRFLLGEYRKPIREYEVGKY